MRLKPTTTIRSHFGSSRGHSWPGLSQWLPRHLPWVWFEATRAALHVWSIVGADGHVRSACVMLVGLATSTIWRGFRFAAMLLRRLFCPCARVRPFLLAWEADTEVTKEIVDHVGHWEEIVDVPLRRMEDDMGFFRSWSSC